MKAARLIEKESSSETKENTVKIDMSRYYKCAGFSETPFWMRNVRNIN